MVQGLSHITFIVKNVDRTSELLCSCLGAEEIYDSKSKNFSVSREKFFLLGGVWLVAMEGEVSDTSYRHIAFTVEEPKLKEIESKLRASGAEIMPSRPRVEGEGKSLYFRDFDNNLFELHSGSLEVRLKRYKL